MTHHISRNPLLSTAVTSSALAAAAMLAAGCGPTSSSSAAGSSGSPADAAPSSAPPSASPSASGGGGTATTPPVTPPATPAPSPASGGSASGTPGTARSDCTTEDLKAAVGDSRGAAGSVYVPIVFTNKSGRTCSLYGFPGVSLANSGGPIGASATRDSSRSRATVTLAPRARASAMLRVTDAQNYPSGTCRADTSSFLLVYPPNETEAVDIPYKRTGCQNKTVKLLQVQPVATGTGG